jgi:DNA-binding response OmpR family regulator
MRQQYATFGVKHRAAHSRPAGRAASELAGRRVSRMTGSPASRRVLVVDDLAEMRAVIGRALRNSGYEVDVASTFAEAQELGPCGYDAVLVDAQLGSERGLDLIEALLSEDPAAAGRCLVMTGGPAENLPSGLACLSKPFQLGELISAVRALHQRGPAPAPDLQAAIPVQPGAAPPESAPSGAVPQQREESQAWRTVRLIRRLRAHERRELTDFLHDGPVQQLTAVTLELQMMSRSQTPGQAENGEATLSQLNAATASLRWLVDGLWPFPKPETDLATALQVRTAWLLAAPVTVDAGQPSAVLGTPEVADIVDVVELMVLAMISAGQQGRAHVMVRVSELVVQIEVTLTPMAEGGRLTGDPLAARACVGDLGGALGTRIPVTFGERHWRSRITLPRE